MNKILIDSQANNYTRFHIKTDKLTYPDNEQDQIVWCENLFNDISNGRKAKQIFLSRQVKRGVLISVIKYQDLYYLSHCFRDGYANDIYTTSIYVSESEQDMLALANFLKQNLKGIKQEFNEMSAYKRNQAKNKRENLLNAQSRIESIGKA